MSGYFDTRYLVQLADQAPMEGDQLRLGVISSLGDADAELEDPSSLKSWIDGRQSEKTAQQQASAHQQRHTESYLRNHQRASQPAAGSVTVRVLLPRQQSWYEREYQ